MTLFYSVIPHLTILVGTILLIVYTDFRALSYFFKKTVLLPRQFVSRSHRLVWLGLCGMIISGFLLAYPAWEYWIQEPTFFVKIGMVFVLFCNAIFIGYMSPIASQRPYGELDRKTKLKLIASGSISTLGWITVIIFSFFFL